MSTDKDSNKQEPKKEAAVDLDAFIVAEQSTVSWTTGSRSTGFSSDFSPTPEDFVAFVGQLGKIFQAYTDKLGKPVTKLTIPGGKLYKMIGAPSDYNISSGTVYSHIRKYFWPHIVMKGLVDIVKWTQQGQIFFDVTLFDASQLKDGVINKVDEKKLKKDNPEAFAYLEDIRKAYPKWKAKRSSYSRKGGSGKKYEAPRLQVE
jgi:hypothetical protein